MYITIFEKIEAAALIQLYFISDLKDCSENTTNKLKENLNELQRLAVFILKLTKHHKNDSSRKNSHRKSQYTKISTPASDKSKVLNVTPNLNNLKSSQGGFDKLVTKLLSPIKLSTKIEPIPETAQISQHPLNPINGLNYKSSNFFECSIVATENQSIDISNFSENYSCNINHGNSLVSSSSFRNLNDNKDIKIWTSSSFYNENNAFDNIFDKNRNIYNNEKDKTQNNLNNSIILEENGFPQSQAISVSPNDLTFSEQNDFQNQFDKLNNNNMTSSSFIVDRHWSGGSGNAYSVIDTSFHAMSIQNCSPPPSPPSTPPSPTSDTDNLSPHPKFDFNNL